MKTRPRVAIVGLGLIGGSLARALRRAGYAVSGWDRPRVLAAAAREGVIEPRPRSLRAALEGAGLVVLAAAPRANRRLLWQVARALPGAVVTDVGSVKRGICADARRRGLTRFVGGHPMAGRERSGFAASSPTCSAAAGGSSPRRGRRTRARCASCGRWCGRSKRGRS